MFEHIVVPLDGSELSETALAYVTPLAVRLNSKVVLLHVDGDPYIDMFGEISTEPSLMSHSNMSDYLNSISERLRSEGVECEAQRATGAAAAVILKYIEEHQPDLIAMSTHGRSGLRRMVVGSVTTTIVPRAQIPALVVHPREDEELSDISLQSLIVPLDMSSRAEEALPLAGELAGALNLDTTLITCIPSAAQIFSGSVYDMQTYPDDLMQQGQEAADEYLQEITGAVNESSGLDAKWESLEGGPASKIVEYAESQPGSLIAMCTQGRTGLGRWVLGSVTDAVIRSGNTPVLVIPHSDDEA